MSRRGCISARHWSSNVVYNLANKTHGNCESGREFYIEYYKEFFEIYLITYIIWNCSISSIYKMFGYSKEKV